MTDTEETQQAVAEEEDDDFFDDDQDRQIFDDMVYLAEAKRLLEEQRQAQAEAIVIQAALNIDEMR